MPPKFQSRLLKKPADIFYALLTCPSCFSASQASRSYGLRTRLPRRFLRSRRFTSTTSTPTVYYGNQYVPERYRELYESLRQLNDSATDHVDSARLQLLLRGLETESPVVRIALLGINDTSTAVKLVRLILADPLSPKAEWEQQLENHYSENTQGLIIRYGEPSETPVTDSSLPTLSIPSITLRNANIEILLSSIRTDTVAPSQIDMPTALEAPTISIGSPGSEHHTIVQYPVHKTIVCGNGIGNVLQYATLVKDIHEDNGSPTVYAAFDFPIGTTPDLVNKSVSLVDIAQAEQALKIFRESVQNATEYERGWTGSGVLNVIQWIINKPEDSVLRPELRGLARSVLNTTETNLVKDENSALEKQQIDSVSGSTREVLSTEVASWAESAHTELRESLDNAFSHYKWRDLMWWKLFWRVDDVGMLSGSILDKQWLTRAETAATWLGGRFQQAGLLSQTRTGGAASREEETEHSFPTAAWPTTIETTRNRLLSTNVPSLHTLAQKLVLYSVSTTTLTSALSILAYLSASTTSLYEAGTIAAVGLIYSLRRQQKRWDAARSYWESEVREEGRKALQETEVNMRKLLSEGGREQEPIPDAGIKNDLLTAKAALENVK